MSESRTTTRVAWSLAATGIVLACAGGILIAVNQASGKVPLYSHWLPDLLQEVSGPVIAAVILSRQPRNAFAWLLMVTGLMYAVANVGQEAAAYMRYVSPTPGAAWVDWVATALGQPGWFLTWLVPQVFPDGKPLSPRWRWLWWLSLGTVAFAAVNFVLQRGRLDEIARFDNPVGVLHPTGWPSVVVGVLFAGACATIVIGGLASLIVRYRRSRGVTRQQLKFFTYVVLTFPVIVAAQDLVPGGFVLGGVVTAAMPVALGVAVLRYGLYEIDRIVSRTVAYAVITGVLIGIYLGCVTLLTRVLPFSSGFGVAVSTLVAVAVLQPLRRRVQSLVDRRFNRARYDASRTVEAFATRLRDEVHADVMHGDLLDVVRRTLEPASASLWQPRRAS